MSDRYNLERLIAESKADPSNMGGVPLLGQQVPVFHGLPVNNGIMTIETIRSLTEDQFRELFVAVIVGLMGGIYMPPNVEGIDSDDAGVNDLGELDEG